VATHSVRTESIQRHARPCPIHFSLDTSFNTGISTIEEAFRSLKPVSLLGNGPEDLKDLQAGMRGYLNNDTRKRVPSR
jgi:hypothetical protein